MHRLVTAALAAAMVAPLANAGDDGPMSFSWVAQDLCLVGDAGTFTPDGDVTNGYNQIPAFGTGTITFHPHRGTATDSGTWMYMLPLFAFPNGGAPLNLFPVRTSTGTCAWNYIPGDGLSWRLETPRSGCGGPDTSGPNTGVVFTFTNGPSVHGQFAADMQSFVAERNELRIENGAASNGYRFERICMRKIQGVRLPRAKD